MSLEGGREGGREGGDGRGGEGRGGEPINLYGSTLELPWNESNSSFTSAQALTKKEIHQGVEEESRYSKTSHGDLHMI